LTKDFVWNESGIVGNCPLKGSIVGVGVGEGGLYTASMGLL